MNIIPATTTYHFQEIEKLAWEILPEFYAPFLPDEHTIFFVKKYQTADAIRKQISNGFLYYLLAIAGIDVGYVGIHPEEEVLLLSKLYILKEYRGNGIGDKVMKFVDNEALEHSIPKIELTVNRLNGDTIKFYENRGFKITEPLVRHFENGYSVQEYKMTKWMI